MRENSSGLKAIIKGANLSLIISLVSILIFAFIVRSALLSNGVIKCVNQFIKIISIFLGCVFFIKGKGGLVKGALLGLLFFILTTLIFALFSAGFTISLSLVIDLFFCVIVGAISGIISVNISR